MALLSRFRRKRPAPYMPPPLPYDGGQIVPGTFSAPPMNRPTATASYTLTPIFTRPPDVVRDQLDGLDADPVPEAPLGGGPDVRPLDGQEIHIVFRFPSGDHSFTGVYRETRNATPAGVWALRGHKLCRWPSHIVRWIDAGQPMPEPGQEDTNREGVAAGGAVPAGDAALSSDGDDGHDVVHTAPEAAPLVWDEHYVRREVRAEFHRQLAELIAPRVRELLAQ